MSSRRLSVPARKQPYSSQPFRPLYCVLLGPGLVFIRYLLPLINRSVSLHSSGQGENGSSLLHPFSHVPQFVGAALRFVESVDPHPGRGGIVRPGRPLPYSGLVAILDIGGQQSDVAVAQSPRSGLQLLGPGLTFLDCALPFCFSRAEQSSARLLLCPRLSNNATLLASACS